ncbi:MAG: AAA family ATPase [Acidiferrobacterales bacterium]|nr:AAA family ATPase [Acidiferrobacterales bacterium]
MESLHDLELLIESDHRLIVLETEREGCFIDGFRRVAKRSQRSYFQWTVTQGLLRLAEGYEPQAMNREIGQLLSQIQSTSKPSVYVLVDFHHYLTDPITIRSIKDILTQTPQHCLILLSQSIELPNELENLARHYSLPLPTNQILTRMVNDLAVQWLSERNTKLKVAEKGILERLVAGLCGLSFLDAQRIAKHAIYNDGIIDQSDLDEVNKTKFDLLNKENVLRLELDYVELDELAGFDNLKQWLGVRKEIFSGKVKLPGGDIPKGMLLLGVQGCGKSLAAKAVAGSWGLPLLHLDFGVLYNRFYGQTEENMRFALDAAEKMQPCVLWLDEVEKGLSAVSSSDDVSKRLLATFLTWLAEKKESVFVVATANDVTALPPELLRKGRFDEVFFVDLPSLKERIAILEIHLRIREQRPESIDLSALADVTDGFSGAELEQLVVSSLYQTYSDSSNEDKAVSTELLIDLAQKTQPLSILMAEKVAAIRDWAVGRAVRV